MMAYENLSDVDVTEFWQKSKDGKNWVLTLLGNLTLLYYKTIDKL